MDEPKEILAGGTRIRTCAVLGSTAGFMVKPAVLQLRKPDTVGVICGIVGGHGGDVYHVAHIGDPFMTVYGWMDFELEPVVEPVCHECKGTGMDFPKSAATKMGTACEWCSGTATAPPRPRPTSWERVQDSKEP